MTKLILMEKLSQNKILEGSKKFYEKKSIFFVPFSDKP